MPYLRLMRLDKPIGIWLLMWPCWWSVTLASQGTPSLTLLALFALGAVLMRSAGCIINDMTDRRLDALVERTKTRPLASGELSMTQALALLLFLLALALTLALILGAQVVIWSAAALPLVVAYPWMKRITWWPQLFLGLTFNWGALLGWVAVRGALEWPALLLYIGGAFWTLGYDTIYAHQDKKDDARIGIKSTARRLGNHTKNAVALFYGLAGISWLAALHLHHIHSLFYLMILSIAGHFIWQLRVLNLSNPDSCRLVFISNASVGAWVWIILLIANSMDSQYVGL